MTSSLSLWSYANLVHREDAVLDLGNSATRVEVLRAGLTAVHDGVAAEELEGVIEGLKALLGGLITRVIDPAESLLKYSRSKVLFGVPPVTGAGSGAASAENAFIHTVELGAVLLALESLAAVGVGSVAVKPGLDGSVLFVEVVHVGYKILNHVHVRERVDDSGRLVVNVGKASKGVATVDVHGTAATDTLTARTAESQGGIHLVLDLDKSIQNHGTALVKVHRVVNHGGLALGVRVVTVDLEVLDALSLLLHFKVASSAHGANLHLAGFASEGASPGGGETHRHFSY
mmetsp:Transcript_19832/g.38873  ORF Transcript_19832/g.38873 Transcript_19832/m.38873 type:complete len:288 (-) Transcript_19832:50-913(-)|eukprot:CAMPEP_0171495618 /NCGR_PEP_ID=MMETSP0958-20121227/6241_1 /TAXON_ID=87120 /ORGANISM="Aurantiochytrium limacinum, Strain ATCCMYA-1381" /LENGTH=287 /DNA_ID=CAMNT_0012029619 /DNA_START=493 /DNA_END=1356 /DNA_ORIENTATION=-